MNHQVLDKAGSRRSLATSMRRAHVPGLVATSVVANRLPEADLSQQGLPDGTQTDEIVEPRVRSKAIVAGPCLRHKLHFLTEVHKVGTRNTVEHESIPPVEWLFHTGLRSGL